MNSRGKRIKKPTATDRVFSYLIVQINIIITSFVRPSVGALFIHIQSVTDPFTSLPRVAKLFAAAVCVLVHRPASPRNRVQGSVLLQRVRLCSSYQLTVWSTLKDQDKYSHLQVIPVRTHKTFLQMNTYIYIVKKLEVNVIGATQSYFWNFKQSFTKFQHDEHIYCWWLIPAQH